MVIEGASQLGFIDFAGGAGGFLAGHCEKVS